MKKLFMLVTILFIGFGCIWGIISVVRNHVSSQPVETAHKSSAPKASHAHSHPHGVLTHHDFVWPVSGNTNPDVPFSSAYGPRLKASESFRYDYHQGLDIPIPLSTTLRAVSTGTVRIAGSHPLYQDGVVQINHGNGLYSNYLHITASLVTTGEEVVMGQPIALSGASDSSFPHIHFEIRDGSVFRRDTINPFHYLPYADTIQHTVAFTAVRPGKWVGVKATALPQELDINQITVTLQHFLTDQRLYSHTLDYEARNLFYLGQPITLDNPHLDNMTVQPHKFNTTTLQYEVDVRFREFPAEPLGRLEACTIDVKLNRVCIQAGYFQYPIAKP